MNEQFPTGKSPSENDIEHAESRKLESLSTADVLADRESMIAVLVQVKEDADHAIRLPGYEPVNVSSFAFNLFMKFGITEWRSQMLSEFLTSALEMGDIEQALEVMKKKHLGWNVMSEQDRRLFHTLSDIIPTMPDDVSAPADFKVPHGHWSDTDYFGYLIDSPGRSSEKTMVKDPFDEGGNQMSFLDVLKRTFKDKTVIDLGAGSGGSPFFGVVRDLGAKNYIGVEATHYSELADGIGDLGLPADTKVYIAPVDMVTFLEQVPDATENIVILMSGIDSTVVGTNSTTVEKEKEGEDYVKKLYEQIYRVLPDGGHLVSNQSIRPWSDEGANFKIVAENPGAKTYILEKIKSQ